MRIKNNLKNCDDDYSMVLIYDGQQGDTIIDGNTELSGNIIIKIRDLVISYLHIRLHNINAKYKIQPSKTETVTNITFHKITVSIESNKILEVTDDEGEMH